MEFDYKNKSSIKNLFNQVAQNYDKLNFIMTFGLQNFIKKSAVKNVLMRMCKKKLKVLDICCGTGDISLFFKELKEDADVIGVDFSEEMLKIAKNRSSKITFLKGDVTNLSKLNLEKESFDICFIGFGLRNLPDVDKFLNEIMPYIKKGGLLSILDLGKPKTFMKPYFYFHYRILILFFAFLFNADVKPYRYFIESEKRYPSQKVILDKLQQSGFIKLENKDFYFGVIAQQIGVKS